MDGLRVAANLIIDRYYRGAIVMAGGKTFAIPEAAIALLEKAQRATASYCPVDDEERALAAALLAPGIFVAVI